MSPPKPSVEPLVQVEDLHAYYGKSHICTASRCRSAGARFVGLLGRNGVGKSTTRKSIIALSRPAGQGAVSTAGPVTGMPAHKLARIGIAYVPGGPAHLLTC